MPVDRFAPPRRAIIVAIVGASVALSPFRTTAAEPTQPTQDAQEDPAALFARAEALYREGRYEEAIEILEALIQAHPEPILRYNLGRAYESAGALEPAIDAYRQYLDAAPDAPDRTSVEARIERLEARMPPEVEPPPPAPVVTPPPEQPSSPPKPPAPIVVPWVVAGAGGAGLIVGGVFGGLTRARVSEAQDNSTSQVRASEAHDEARRFSTVSTVSLIAGSALVVAGVTWGIIATRKNRRSRASGGPGGLALKF